jgi:hypothetical protein
MRAVPLPLICHPATATDLVRKLEVHVSRGETGLLELRYVLEAQMDRLRIPPPRAPARRDELWKHTCFEAFLGTESGAAYRELNFAPSGEWAMYSFTAYRQGMGLTEAAIEPKIAVDRGAQQLTLSASAQTGLPAPGRLALAAVIEDEDGRLSYWALRHPPGKPDFHHPESFVAST